MSGSEPNAQQRAAIDVRGTAFVSAGAGTGKTRVLVERFARAVTEGGLDVSSLLVVTFTERAAAELAARIRARLIELGRHDLARTLDLASIHTIHGYCRRLLAAHPFEAGIDPRFHVLPTPHQRVLQGEAFTEALRSFCGDDDAERWRLVTMYGAERLRSMLLEVYGTLRSAGRDLVLELRDERALDDCVNELWLAAEALIADPGATPLNRTRAATALAFLGVPTQALHPDPLEDDKRKAERLPSAVTTLPDRLDGLEYRYAGARGPSAAAYEVARKAVIAAAWEVRAERDCALLQPLLVEFAAAYAAAKERESALDYEDLQLRARNLLRNSPEVRARERERYRAVMVDEFQDTNRLQTDVLDLLVDGADMDVLFVGDEFQSIYGFRHADVDVFRERRKASANILELNQNYRSRPAVLAAVNELFSGEFRDEFRPLEAAANDDPPLEPAFELLVTNKQWAVLVEGEHWRRSEARHVARRVRELVDAGDASPGEIVLLFAAGTDAALYEEELRALGLPTLRMTRTSYWGQQQVADLLAYLRLLRNRYDDEALLTVLAAPFVGVTNDALVLIRANAKAALWKGIENEFPAALDEDDARLLRAFVQRYERLVALSYRLSLEQLCERILVEHDYDLAVLARHDGVRRLANLRMLARLAKEYESLRGADLEGFIEFVAAQQSIGGPIDDAVSEEADSDAVRLMTIHAAKGLEFRVVIIADAGRDRPKPPELICLSNGQFGFKVAHPERNERHGTPSFEAVAAVRETAERAERLRLFYVGMTRAMERLIVAGSVAPGGTAGDVTPIGWVLDRLQLMETVQSATEPVEVQRGEARVLLRVDRGQPPVEVPAETDAVEDPAEPPQLELFGEARAPAAVRTAPVLDPLPTAAEPPLLWPERLSFSAMSTFERCPYRFYVERAGGLREARQERGAGRAGVGLAGTEIGDAVHRLLEQIAVGSSEPTPPADLEGTVRTWYPSATDADVVRIRAHVEAFCSSSLARRLGALPDARVEQPFVFEQDDVLLNGRLDVFHCSGASALVADFKTNALEGRAPAAIIEDEYSGQRDLYALAALRAGATEVEVVYQFLEAPDDLVSARFGPDDAPALEARLAAAIAGIRAGAFPATPSAFVCDGCPALGRVCAGVGGGFPVAAR